jgi:hypothetical protein
LPSSPQIVLQDLVEQIDFPFICTSAETYSGSPLFRVATYNVQIYPGASYAVSS